MRILTAILFLTTLACYGQDKNPISLGLGIVALQDTYNESKVVTIYKDKNFSGKIEDFRLYAQLKRIRPFAWKPDYGLCYFVCLEKTKDYYRILINNQEEGFLKNDSDTRFKTWESLLINTTVERLDAKTNPLKVEPGDDQRSIDVKYDVKANRLEVLDVVEVNGQHWIHVRFSKTGVMPCTPDCDMGWVKWRAGDKLLVNLLFLC